VHAAFCSAEEAMIGALASVTLAEVSRDGPGWTCESA
jgi:hypothetical protein